MSGADSKLKDLSISEGSKKGPKNAPKAAPKKKETKKTEGAALIGIDVKKEVDLAEWFALIQTA
jgi:prolyl-tRNA synthetase